jgi:hypothetical protein
METLNGIHNHSYIPMKMQARLETQRARVYRKSYRPSTNMYHFIRTVIIILIKGQSPYGSQHAYLRKKK